MIFCQQVGPTRPQTQRKLSGAELDSVVAIAAERTDANKMLCLAAWVSLTSLQNKYVLSWLTPKHALGPILHPDDSDIHDSKNRANMFLSV